MKVFFVWLALFLGATTVVAQSHSYDTPKCKLYFGIAAPDGTLNSVMTESQQEWYAKKGAKKYSSTCYVPARATYWLRLHTGHDVYQKKRTVTETVQGTEKGTVEVTNPQTQQVETGTYSGTVTLPVEKEETVVQSNYYAGIKIYRVTVLNGRPTPVELAFVYREYQPSQGGLGVFSDVKTQEPDRRVLEDALKLLTKEASNHKSS